MSLKVVCDAAHWCVEGDESGPLVTLDSTDIVSNASEINETLVAEMGEDWRLEITVPMEVPVELEDASPERTGLRAPLYVEA